jgi:hypothetical protein
MTKAKKKMTKRKIGIDTHTSKLTVENTGLVSKCHTASGWNVETNCGTEFVGDDCVIMRDDEYDGMRKDELYELFCDYVEGSEIYHCTYVDEWHAYWDMPGYMDRGSIYSGETEVAAIVDLLESNESEESNIDDWCMAAIERLVQIHNDSEDDNIREECLSAICWHLPSESVDFRPEVLCNNTDLIYSGDCNPIDHDGRWIDTRDWAEHGYASCVGICSYDNLIDIEFGTINKTGTLAEMATCYGIDVDEITMHHKIDYAHSQFGAENGDNPERFTRLDDSGWFLDDGNELVAESTIEARLIELVKGLAE